MNLDIMDDRYTLRCDVSGEEVDKEEFVILISLRELDKEREELMDRLEHIRNKRVANGYEI